MGMLQKVVLALTILSGRGQASIPSLPGFTLTWGDDFEGSAGAAPSSANWIIDIGTSYPGGPSNWGTGEIQFYTDSPDNLKLSGTGNLQITARKGDNGDWTSARIETQRADFVCKQGQKMRIQASLSLPDVGPDAIGYWPAFWTLGSAYRGNYQNWPSVGEFDIMENVNGINRVWGVLHCGVNPGGPCQETDGIAGSRGGHNPPLQGNFHTYTFEVDRTSEVEAINWFVDGTLFWQVTSSDIPFETWSQAVHSPHFVLINLAIGGAFPNNNFGSSTPLSSTASGGTFEAEYIAVYNS